MNHETMLTASAVILALCGLANLLLLVCLAHTWKYWRQVKWYILLLAVGNVLQTGFTQGLEVGVLVSHSLDGGSTGTCRFLTFMAHLGISLTAMALAALGLHVLLTCVSGCQGTRLRHGLVMGLFLLLSLPMPLARMSMAESVTYDHQRSVCHLTLDGAEDHWRVQVGETVSSLCFPLAVVLCCCVASAVFLRRAARRTDKGDEDKSDVILTAALGVALLVLWTPYFITVLDFFGTTQLFSASKAMFMFKILKVLRYVMNCFPFVSALITIVFAYLHAFRNRGELLVPLRDSSTASGERQKLVQ